MEILYGVIGIVVIIAIFIMNPMGTTETIFFISFLIIIGVMGVKYYYNIDISAYIQGLFSNPTIKMEVTQYPEQDAEIPIRMNTSSKGYKEQVFHVTGQYDFLEAKALCRAYGGKLASMSQMMEGYNKGAEWCNYGWSEDGMALYPTQYATWKKLKEENRDGVCGVPGVNGGYVNHKYALGANCYATKPAGTVDLQDPMFNTPQSLEDMQLSERVTYWKSRLPQLKVDPFNPTTWSA
jgi:hypothetical protein